MTIEQVIDRLLSWFHSQVGYVEKATGNLSCLSSKTANAGSNNYTIYGYKMHNIQPSNMDYPAAWCDAFVDCGFVEVFGVENARKLLHDFDDYTVRSAELYKNYGEWHTSPKRGDQIFFKNSTGICHTGIVYKVDGSRVYTIEGNTSTASGVVDNGGGVAYKSYPISYNRIAGYGRPNYAMLAVEKKHYGEYYLNKLYNAGYIEFKDLWKYYDSPTKICHVLALLDKIMGRVTWTSNETDPSFHWAQPNVISLCGKQVIHEKEKWLPNLNAYISKAMLLALIDSASGGMRTKYVGRKTDHWGRNHLDSLCDKVIVGNPEVWCDDFEAQVSNAQVMALLCKAFGI